MLKRQSGGGNTLLNYFKKVQSKSSSSEPENGSDTSSANLSFNTPKKENKPPNEPLNTSNDDDELIPPTKRKRIVNTLDSSDDEADVSIVEKKIKLSVKTPSKSRDTPAKKVSTPLAKVSNNISHETDQSNEIDKDCWLHNKLEFLKPSHIKDKYGKRADHPDYDGRTLWIPDTFLEKQTPAMRQWWIMKRDHYDCILFFKVGKFYELYHMDAVTGVNDLGLTFMKGEFAHSGFPESAYGRMMSGLMEHGHKVARVEQTETPEAMAERLRKTARSGKFAKVVMREICQITSKATRVQGMQDIDIKTVQSSYLLALLETSSNGNPELGVCFIDTTIGKFYLGQFEDDCRYSRLLTMLAQYPPAMILEERRQLSNDIKNVLKNSAGSADYEVLNSESQFYSSSKTLKILQENNYFKDKDTDNIKLPDVLQDMICENDSLNITCKKQYDLALRCLGACVWYLQKSLLDIQLLTMSKFKLYVPTDIENKSATAGKYMVLDSCTLSSLNLLGPSESLQSTLDHCCTAFGKRLLHQWVCRPVCNIDVIQSRQEAVAELINRPDLVQSAREVLLALPDLERLISKIHWMGNALRAKNHPDSRAIFYDERIYSKRKIHDFMAALNGFEKAMALSETFADVKSEMLRKHILSDPEGFYPDMSQTLNFFKNSFNVEEAEKEGKIIPEYGLDNEYDSTIDEIKSIEEKLEEYRLSQEKFFGCSISYFGSDKKRFQLDIPERATHKVTRGYYLEGAKKGSKPSKRYTTDETKSLLAQMMAAEAKKRDVLKDLNRRIFEKFSAKYEDWNIACNCLAVIDVLMSFAEYVRSQSIEMCVPEILPFSSSPTLDIKDGVHPYIPNVESFVPNDTEMGTDGHPTVLILTGPNMGGKSTLMRQVALLTIMAHMGLQVPASSMKLTMVDRIFTRLGAHDDIMAGNSTFLVELREASAILHHSTRNSLVFLDELGRGTSTYDGSAIATAYVDQLCKILCRTMFSTHYYSLLDYLKKNPNIQLGHMACKVESDEDNITQETVIFMYKMISGPCPKSYGFNAARLAGIPISITNRASYISKKLEVSTLARKMFRKIFCEGKNVRELLNNSMPV